MKIATYTKYSPYATTDVYGNFLDVLNYRSIPKYSLDVLYIIDSMYNNRPDLLAADLYESSALWWVFAVRNPDVLKDPIYDFTEGKKIYIPTKETISTELGI
jgi:hypothetical protein